MVGAEVYQDLLFIITAQDLADFTECLAWDNYLGVIIMVFQAYLADGDTVSVKGHHL